MCIHGSHEPVSCTDDFHLAWGKKHGIWHRNTYVSAHVHIKSLKQYIYISNHMYIKSQDVNKWHQTLIRVLNSLWLPCKSNLRYLRLLHGHNSIISIEAGSWNTGSSRLWKPTKTVYPPLPLPLAGEAGLSNTETRRVRTKLQQPNPVKPIGSMYGISTYIWLIFWPNVGRYTIIHGSYGKGHHNLLYKWSNAAVSKKQSDGETLHCHCYFDWCSRE